ncbi:lipopolysaccharide biosynthesis protein [Caulobacter hibisci]|uniref:Lipopolysaccharide biosynthesis protein n=1 Tax=Caulobacter hibisci TaxID=2035993 RepID=A0ABS0SW12_9CAUL|nr:lipopolysaccharide biosynthesis protein [Caulobacter hibisci]MBI1683837.1 lipopolysaccharide biosynthesis protein [Caulobacter hibisci]
MSGPQEQAKGDQPRGKPLARVLANAGALLGGRGVNAIVGLAYMAIAGRSLGLAAFGVLTLINAFAQALGEVAKFQSWQTVVQYGAKPLLDGDKPTFQQVLRFALILDAIGALVGVTLGVGGALLFSKTLGWSQDMAPAAALYCLSIAAMTSATAVGLLRLFDRFKMLAAEQAISSTVRLAGCAIAAALHAPVEGFLLAWAAGTVASFAYVAAIAVWSLHGRGLLAGFSFKGPLAAGQPGIWRFAWATNFSSTIDVGFTHVLTLAVGALVGPGPAALWRIGRQVADGMAKPARLMLPALHPEFAKLRAQKNDAAMLRLARQIGVIGGGVAGLLLLVCLLAGQWLLTVIMGAEFAPAAGIMTWQVAAAAIGVMALPIEPMLVSMRAAGAALRVRIIVCVAYLAALAPLLKTFGLTGAGAALVLAMAGMAVGMLLTLRSKLRHEAAAERESENLFAREQACVDPRNERKGDPQ